MFVLRPGIVEALAAAALFGASAPLAKLLVGTVPPVLLAGLLYLGSGAGLLGWWLWRRRTEREATETPLARGDLPWLAGAILAGGVIGPVLLMWGLLQVPAAHASLLLNLEGVFTAMLAWLVFREHFDRRIAFGMACIVAGGAMLAWTDESGAHVTPWALAIAGACLAWAVDNNLTRRVSAGDPVQIAGIKGLIAGLVNTGIAFSMGSTFPAAATTAAVLFTGMFGYGLSLVLFVLALRNLGSARTAAYFSIAPFIGATLSIAMLGESPGPMFWGAAGLMAVGVWLHLTERHEHMHEHEPLAHSHRHVHDEHHQHEHDAGQDEREPHAHFHVHAPLRHSHPHYPDLHHRHGHD